MVADGSAMIVTLLDPLAPHPAPLVTVTESATEPETPAAKAMLRVPAPPVIVPFVIVQTYDDPAPPSATEAAPVALAQIVPGAEIAPDGTGFSATLCEPLAVQPGPVWTVTPSVIGLDAPTANVTLRVPAPAVMIPFVMVQTYVAPVPASETEATPLPPTQTPAGAVIAVDGDALITTFWDPLAEQPASLWTVTDRLVEPLIPAVNMTFGVPAPPVIVPFVIDQE